MMTHEEQARVDYVLTLRRRWADVLYPALVDACGERPGEVRELPLHRWFAWFERGSQKQLWRTVESIVTADPELTDFANDGESHGRLELDPDLRLPSWYTGIDIHLQPGGIWSSRAAARVYELGAKLVMLGENDDYAFHELFTRTAVPRRPYRRIVDLGCGFGKSTRPFKKAYPDADVIGVDLAAPVLELGHAQAERQGVALDLRQRDCADTRLDTGSCDLVTATMLIHELPTDALVATIEEAARILAPGGLLRVLDFHLTGQPVRDVAMRDHGARNNEPFMPLLFDTDLVAVCERAGLEGVRWVTFDERGAGPLDGLTWPERSEWHFPWAVLMAGKPEEA